MLEKIMQVGLFSLKRNYINIFADSFKGFYQILALLAQTHGMRHLSPWHDILKSR